MTPAQEYRLGVRAAVLIIAALCGLCLLASRCWCDISGHVVDPMAGGGKMIETRAGFLKLHSPYEKYKDGQFISEYRHVWMNRSAIRGLTACNGTMGKTFVYAPDVPAYGRGAFAWECIETIEDILDAIERIDKSATMHQTDTTQRGLI